MNFFEKKELSKAIYNQQVAFTTSELEELEKLSYNTGLRGPLLRKKFLERDTSKSKGGCPEVIPDAYPNESLDLFLAVHELDQRGLLPKRILGGKCATSYYLPTSKHKDAIKSLIPLLYSYSRVSYRRER